jgi:hypothetical protein
MAGRKKTAEVDHEMAGSRKRRKASTKVPAEMPEGVAGALEKVRELNEAESDTVEEETSPQISELRDLLFFGRVKERVSIGGYFFELTTLTNKQQRELISRLVKMSAEERLLHIKPTTLALSLVSINGLPAEELYDGQEELDTLDMKLEVISEMQSALVERLFVEYEKINDKSNEVTGLNDLGEQVKK